MVNNPRLTVDVVGAHNLMLKDGEGSSSIYVKLEFDRQKSCITTSKEKDTNPVWNESFYFNINDISKLQDLVLNAIVYQNVKGALLQSILGKVQLTGNSFVPYSEAAVLHYPLEKRGFLESQESLVTGELELKVYVIDDPSIKSLNPRTNHFDQVHRQQAPNDMTEARHTFRRQGNQELPTSQHPSYYHNTDFMYSSSSAQPVDYMLKETSPFLGGGHFSWKPFLNSISNSLPVAKSEMDTTERLMEDIGIEHTKRFSCEELKTFTIDFSERLGSGGFAVVYKGKLPINGEQVAVKVLKWDLLSDGIKGQLKAEMSVLCKIHHRNVVRLYGFCFERNMNALVFEFMENKSLDKLLNGAQNIEWKILLNIVIGTAKGLSYLHEDCQPNIIHYDIKPANILLDSKFSPKIGDFGLAKHLNQDKTHITESKVRGTFNYMAPEIMQPYSPITSKCDVYSFGMMLFDIVGRTRSAKLSPYHVWKEFDQKREEKVMEECGIRVNDREQATRILLIALCCVQLYPYLRPPMSRVLTLLEGREEIKMLSTNPLGHFDSFTPKNSAPSSSSSLNREPEGVSERTIMKHYEEKKKESVNGKVTRTRLFLATTKDGVSPQVDEIRKLVSIDPYLGEKDLDNDPVVLVFGRDWKGRVRALGRGISKTTLNASALYRESAEREKRKNKNLDAKLKVCMQRIDEETRARMLVEERLASFINCSTDSGNASQGRRPSLSTSSGSSIPSSTRCLVKNFKRKFIALGNVCTDITPSEDTYSVRIDDVFDYTSELYVGEGTFEDISVGDTITWPRTFVEFI